MDTQSWYEKYSNEEKEFVDDLCQCSVLEIVRSDEFQKYIDDGIFKSINNYFEMIHDGFTFLHHKCDSRCLVRTRMVNLDVGN